MNSSSKGLPHRDSPPRPVPVGSPPWSCEAHTLHVSVQQAVRETAGEQGRTMKPGMRRWNLTFW